MENLESRENEIKVLKKEGTLKRPACRYGKTPMNYAEHWYLRGIKNGIGLVYLYVHFYVDDEAAASVDVMKLFAL